MIYITPVLFVVGILAYLRGRNRIGQGENTGVFWTVVATFLIGLGLLNCILMVAE